MTNPFDRPDADFRVLINDDGQHSLWPATTAVPGGWRVVHGPAGRADCVRHVDDNWTDQRPRSLAEQETHR
jgi:MbtH protein